MPHIAGQMAWVDIVQLDGSGRDAQRDTGNDSGTPDRLTIKME